MGFFEVNATAAAQAISYMGQPFTFRGLTYRGIFNELESQPDLLIGGEQANWIAALYVRKSGFPVPTVGESVNLGGQTYRINSIQSDVISYTLNLENPVQ
jgi:hypothetical protein